MYGGPVYPVLEPALSGDDMYPEMFKMFIPFLFCQYKNVTTLLKKQVDLTRYMVNTTIKYSIKYLITSHK